MAILIGCIDSSAMEGLTYISEKKDGKKGEEGG